MSIRYSNKYSDNNYRASFFLGRYLNTVRSQRAIEVIDSDTGEVLFTATVHIPDEVLKDDEVIIKSYSENEGVLQWLYDNGIVTEIVRNIQCGYCLAQVCKVDFDKIKAHEYKY